MPTYLYKCRRHGEVEITKPMERAGQEECCPRWITSKDDAWVCGRPLTRVWSVPSLIVRPWGYHLDPHHPDYWNINRAQEVSTIPSPDAKSNLSAGAPSDEELEADEYRGVPFPQPSEDGMQKLHEVARATFSESGSRL